MPVGALRDLVAIRKEEIQHLSWRAMQQHSLMLLFLCESQKSTSCRLAV